MQAIFYFLLCIGTLPPYPQQTASSSMPAAPKSPIGHLLQPFDALTLLVSAIGHDVGHPGVNNAFLVALNAPLAQLYNDKSVLESFHCAAYSQILRRYWKSTFADTAMRGLMISSILATDMGLHFKYMADLGDLQEKIYQNQGTQGWSPQVLDEYRTLTCGLLIKCADISNVVRPPCSHFPIRMTKGFCRPGHLMLPRRGPKSFSWSSLIRAPWRTIWACRPRFSEGLQNWGMSRSWQTHKSVL